MSKVVLCLERSLSAEIKDGSFFMVLGEKLFLSKVNRIRKKDRISRMNRINVKE